MKLLSKKSGREASFHVLNEKEIQERLYGRYHRETMSRGREVGTNSLLSPAGSGPRGSTVFSLSQRLVPFLKTCREFTFALVRKFPWKFAVAITGLLGASLIVFPLISFWFAKAKSVMDASQKVVQEEIQTNPTETAMVPPVSRPVPVSVTQSQSNAPIVPKRKYYAVQVCTYERERDARQLTSELRNMNFPAFYRRFLSTRHGIPHYVVFLSQEESFTGANARLNEFRKTKHFLTFSDSFIRSL